MAIDFSYLKPRTTPPAAQQGGGFDYLKPDVQAQPENPFAFGSPDVPLDQPQPDPFAVFKPVQDFLGGAGQAASGVMDAIGHIPVLGGVLQGAGQFASAIPGLAAKASGSPAATAAFDEAYKTNEGGTPGLFDVPAEIRGLSAAEQARQQELGSIASDTGQSFGERAKAGLGATLYGGLPYVMPVPGAEAIGGLARGLRERPLALSDLRLRAPEETLALPPGESVPMSGAIPQPERYGPNGPITFDRLRPQTQLDFERGMPEAPLVDPPLEGDFHKLPGRVPATLADIQRSADEASARLAARDLERPIEQPTREPRLSLEDQLAASLRARGIDPESLQPIPEPPYRTEPSAYVRARPDLLAKHEAADAFVSAYRAAIPEIQRGEAGPAIQAMQEALGRAAAAGSKPATLMQRAREAGLPSITPNDLAVRGRAQAPRRIGLADLQASPRGTTFEEQIGARLQPRENLPRVSGGADPLTRAELERIRIERAGVAAASPQAVARFGPPTPDAGRLAVERFKAMRRSQAADVAEAQRAAAAGEIPAGSGPIRPEERAAYEGFLKRTGLSDHGPTPAGAQIYAERLRAAPVRPGVPPPRPRVGLRDLLRPRSFDSTMSVWNLPKALKASLDLSAPLRQGILLLPGHPREFAGALKPMVEALADERFARTLDRGLRTTDRPGLYLAPLDGALGAREEAFISNLANKIPGISASNRAYVTFLNKLRADVYDNTLASWERGGKRVSVTDRYGLADVINHFTGRGDLPSLFEEQSAQRATAILNGMFFSPRFAISRFQSVGDALGVLKSRDSLAARQAASDLVKFVGAGIAVLTLAELAGAKVESDPRSSAFGKIQVTPDTSVELWGGMQPLARYTAQLITGQSRPVAGQHANEIVVAKRSDTLGRFVESKLSPTTGAVYGLLRGTGKSAPPGSIGTDFIGRPFSLADLFNPVPGASSESLITPLGWDDIVDAVQADLARGGSGVAGALAGAGSLFGAGVQTIEREQPTPRPVPAPRPTRVPTPTPFFRTPRPARP